MVSPRGTLLLCHAISVGLFTPASVPPLCLLRVNDRNGKLLPGSMPLLHAANGLDFGQLLRAYPLV